MLHRLRGDLLKASGDRPGAERHYHGAIAVAERQSARLLQLRASVSLARLWRDQGNRAEPAICSVRSTIGSPKASTRPT